MGFEMGTSRVINEKTPTNFLLGGSQRVRHSRAQFISPAEGVLIGFIVFVGGIAIIHLVTLMVKGE